MGELENARALIASGRYNEAKRVLNKLVMHDRENDQLWYLLAILALKLKNYENVHEYLERAIAINKKPEYLQLKGMAHMEIFEINEAIEAFNELLKIEPNHLEGNFFLAICYLLIDDPQSEIYIKKAYQIDKKRTKRLLKNFFDEFINYLPETDEDTKRKIEKELETLS
jgi:tetratricopeptide (TPR) repeat protein